MNKSDKFSPKAIANKQKSKGLQKLRWYCQMCQKQCRDQNGFKCHMSSESHQRQLLLFGDNPGKYLSEFNTDFQKGFLDILRRQFGTKRVKANMVYGEYIRNKEHVHMNATSWHTLTGFIHYLARAGIAKIDQTEKGWYIQYIDREEEEQRARDAKKQRMDRDDDELIADFVARQAERDRARKEELGIDNESEASTELRREEVGGAAVAFSLKKSGRDEESGPSTSALAPTPNAFAAKRPRSESSKEERRRGDGEASSKKPRSALDEIREAEERRKELANRRENWLAEGIVVKVSAKRLGDSVHKRKGVVTELIDDFTAMVRILNGGPLVKLDQTNCETVIPGLGKSVRVLNGAYRGAKATLESLDEAAFAVNARVEEGPSRGRLLKLPYEDVSKIQTQ